MKPIFKSMVATKAELRGKNIPAKKPSVPAMGKKVPAVGPKPPTMKTIYKAKAKK